MRRAVIVHDLHHLLSGLDADLVGEVRLAAWELGAGGCGWNLFFWVDRLVALLLGALWRPRAC